MGSYWGAGRERRVCADARGCETEKLGQQVVCGVGKWRQECSRYTTVLIDEKGWKRFRSDQMSSFSSGFRVQGGKGRCGGSGREKD